MAVKSELQQDKHCSQLDALKGSAVSHVMAKLVHIGEQAMVVCREGQEKDILLVQIPVEEIDQAAGYEIGDFAA